jgi:D-sedoheptulose 7-phosphate isomerase
MANDLKKHISKIVQAHKKVLASFEKDAPKVLIAAAGAISNAIKHGGRIYICGNGGSAADAQHIASEIVGRFERERKALPAIALTTDTSVLTSVSNDYGFEIAFTRQVEALVTKGDVLWAISTSGSSPNIVAAAKLAKRQGATVIAFTGKANSRLEKIADICFCTNEASTARSQEMHQLAYHIICDIVERTFTDK